VREDNVAIEGALMTCRQLGIPAFTLTSSTSSVDPFLNALGSFEGDLPDETVAEMILHTFRKPLVEIVQKIQI